MTEIGALTIEGNILKDKDGNDIAVIDSRLDNNIISSYARAFAMVGEMLVMLESLAADAVADFEQQYQSAVDFNNQPNVPSMGASPKNIPELPEWVMNALALVTKVKGDKPIEKT